MPAIEHLSAIELLDSRGRPTVGAYCQLRGGPRVLASVPSGASTGSAEARELRDGDRSRFGGLGCLKAVQNINTTIARAVRGKRFDSQADFDQRVIQLDGTRNKSRLGANAILACSLAFARASAARRRTPLYNYFGELVGRKPATLPRLTINLFSGGKHAGGQVEIQDVLMVPHARTIRGALAVAHAVYYAAATLCAKKYGMRLLRADEGGLAPPARCAEELLDDAISAINHAGLRLEEDLSLSLDVAASHFYRRGRYEIGGKRLTSPQMIDRVVAWARDYRLYTVEDGLAENDWPHWPDLTSGLLVGAGAVTIGDDLLCTNPARIARAIRTGSAMALLLKVNQIGALTEAAQAWRIARQNSWPIVVSARSGETEDNWLADLAVAWGDMIKVGSITQGERLAKYNRLLEIERETNWPVANYPALY